MSSNFDPSTTRLAAVKHHRKPAILLRYVSPVCSCASSMLYSLPTRERLNKIHSRADAIITQTTDSVSQFICLC